MQITIMLFSSLRSQAGQNHFDIELPQDEATVADVRQVLIQQFPQLEANMEQALASVNRDYAFNENAVVDGDEVAFFPPVSGGSGESEKPEIFRLPYEPINHDELIEAITTPATGAVYLFSGLVRGETVKEGKIIRTEKLEYEAYVPMALEKMKQVAKEIREKWPQVVGIALVQRLGELKVGTPTILIAVSSAHRDGLHEAARYGIDRIKEIVPVWKKEVGVGGEEWIEGDYIPTPDDRAD